MLCSIAKKLSESELAESLERVKTLEDRLCVALVAVRQAA